MDKLTQWIALTVVAVLVIVAGSWFLLVSPKRHEAADVRAQTASQESANDALKTQITLLKSQAKDLPQKQAKLAAVYAKIPDNPSLPALIRSLTVAADDANVELVSMSPAPPVAVAAPAAAAGTTTTTTKGAAATGPGAAARAATASAGTLQSIALNLNVVGGYFQVEQFFDRLESLTRAVSVSSLSLSPGANPVKPAAPLAPGAVAPVLDPSNTLVASITATVYMASGRATAAALGK